MSDQVLRTKNFFEPNTTYLNVTVNPEKEGLILNKAKKVPSQTITAKALGIPESAVAVTIILEIKGRGLGEVVAVGPSVNSSHSVIVHDLRPRLIKPTIFVSVPRKAQIGDTSLALGICECGPNGSVHYYSENTSVNVTLKVCGYFVKESDS